jgi:tellurite resistance protein
VVLTRLVALGTTPETVAALAVVPLVAVAWADGEVDEKERRAILDGLEEAGVAAGGIEHQLVDSWLARPPEPKLLDAWTHYMHGLCERMTEAERLAFRDELLKTASNVAEASGGLGGFFKISASEREVLEQLQAAFA